MKLRGMGSGGDLHAPPALQSHPPPYVERPLLVPRTMLKPNLTSHGIGHRRSTAHLPQFERFKTDTDTFIPCFLSSALVSGEKRKEYISASAVVLISNVGWWLQGARRPLCTCVSTICRQPIRSDLRCT